MRGERGPSVEEEGRREEKEQCAGEKERERRAPIETRLVGVREADRPIGVDVADCRP